MIHSFRDSSLRTLFKGGKYPKNMPADVRRRVRRKLGLLNAAKSLQDLRKPLSNHLEKLVGDLKGKHSIRINKKYRFIFEWKDGDVHDLYLDDYH